MSISGSGDAGVRAAQGSAKPCRRCHHVTPGSRCGTTLDSTSCCLARVIATYRAFNSSRLRAASSVANASTTLGAGRLSLAKKTKLAGATASPGQSTSTLMVAARLGSASVSSISTSSASSPLAPWMVSNLMPASSLSELTTGALTVWVTSTMLLSPATLRPDTMARTKA